MMMMSAKRSGYKDMISNSLEYVIATKLFYQIICEAKSQKSLTPIIKIFLYNSSVIWERGGDEMGKYSKLRYPIGERSLNYEITILFHNYFHYICE